MKLIGTATLIGMGIFAGLVYINNIEITNLQTFFLISVFIVVFSFTVPRQEDAHDILACSNKAIALFSSFLIGGVGLLTLYFIYSTQTISIAGLSALSDYVPAILTLLASYSFINITLLIKSGKAKHSPFLCVPLIWVTFELIQVFKKVSANPILIEFILEFFVLSSCTILLLQFAKTFNTTNRRIYFKASAIMTSFFVFAYYVVLFGMFMTMKSEQPLDQITKFAFDIKNLSLTITYGLGNITYSFETIRLLILSTSIILYMAPFYNRKH